MKKKTRGQEGIMQQVQSIIEDRGTKALETARKEVLKEQVECKEVQEALEYFIIHYWHDFARPALLSLTCEAVGGNPDTTTPIAVALTLISGAIDIHDDIIDESKIKGSRPTVLGKFGRDIALLVGDAFLFKGFKILNESTERGIPASKVAAIVDIVKRMFFELGDAEALELQFRNRIDIDPKDYLRILKKKAADVEAHTRISAILGDASKKELEALGNYGRILGILIILRDELIDTIDPNEFLHRIKKECLPLPIIYALQESKIETKLRSILSKKSITKGDAKIILKLINRVDAPTRVQRIMESLAEEAMKHIENVKKNRNYLTLLLRAMLEFD